MREPKRGIFARIGLVLLNVLAPGLGLWRRSRWQSALAIYALKMGAMSFLLFGPLAPFAFWAVAMLALIGVYVVSIVATWLLSRQNGQTLPVWRRWYAVVVVALIAIAIDAIVVDQDRLAYRNFYVPAESMSPTLPKGDRFVAYMRPSRWRRGDIVLVRAPTGDIYVKRLLGFPGDQIAMVAGQIVLNGNPVLHDKVATTVIGDPGLGRAPATILAEQFPGEATSHRIYDIGRSPGDDYETVTVRPGNYFLLGDHRDRSADSRFPPEEFGLEQVPARNILGRALFHSWGSSRSIGTPVSASR